MKRRRQMANFCAISALVDAAKRRNPLPTGTLVVGAGLLVAGLSAYAFLALSQRMLGEHGRAPLGAQWSLVFLLGPGLFLPLEQEVSRALADRRTRGVGGAPVVRRAATIGVGLLLGVLIVLIATARPIVDKLSADINKALLQPDSLERWKTLGFDPIGTTPEAFAERQKADLDYWKRMIEYTNIKVE